MSCPVSALQSSFICKGQKILVDWQPIGYQVLTNPDGRVGYQFRAAAKLEKLGEFASDIGGSVIGYELVDIDEVNQRIGHGDVGERIIQIAKTIKQNISEKEQK